MNSSTNTSEQQRDPNWGTENWDHPGLVVSLEGNRPSIGNHLDWDWDNSMIAAQQSGGGNDGNVDHKSTIPVSMASSLRVHTGILSSGFPSNFSQNPMGGIFSSPAIQGFGCMDSTSINSPSSSPVPLSSDVPGIPGLAPTGGGDGDTRSSFEQRRRRYFGVMEMRQKVHPNDLHVKREIEVFDGDGHGTRIGLNLGVRTYFSTEDTTARRLGKRHRSNSPASQVPTCQAEGCKTDLSSAKHYHRRHKVCELHSKASNVIIAGHTQRFCQQCSRFHLLLEFDEGKRSCRKRLADHNRRRRKPQPAASHSESIALKIDEPDKRTPLSKELPSMLMHLKSGSPCSASIENSDDKVGSAGKNLQLHTSSGNERASRTMILNSQTSPMSGSGAEAILSAMSITPPALMIQNTNHQLSVLPVNCKQAAVYQQFLQGGVGGQAGPDLSLSSLGGGLVLGSQAWRSSSELKCNGIEHPESWLRSVGARSGITETGNKSRLDVQKLALDTSGPGSNLKVTSTGTTSVRQVYSTAIQNLLPGIQSREINASEWMIESGDDATYFSPLSLRSMPGTQLEGHEVALLECTAGVRDVIPSHGRGGRALEFIHRRGCDVVDGTQAGGTDIKFPELQAVGPGSFHPCIYDANENIM